MSDAGIGCVLSQIHKDGLEHVAAYGSRVLSKAERNYCVTRCEQVAVVYFTKQFRLYLLVRHFVLRSDYGSLARGTNCPMVTEAGRVQFHSDA